MFDKIIDAFEPAFPPLFVYAIVSLVLSMACLWAILIYATIQLFISLSS